VDFTRLSLIDVTKNYGRRRALNRVTITCDAGEIVALLGPNGAGKSTLLAIAAGLLEPSSGDVRYGEHTASAGRMLRARIGLLAHDLYVYADLTAEENLLFFARLYELPDPAGAVGQALVRSNLLDRRGDVVAGFSRGMRQRLAIERALIHGPRLVLLDEPFTGLDDASIVSLQKRLASLRDTGCIVLLTTHDVDAVEAIADRAVLLAGGRLAELPKGAGRLRERYRQASGLA
jgi:heme exporter protein A